MSVTAKRGYTATIFGASGSGKTWNSLTLPGKVTLLSTDFSYPLAHRMVNPKATVIEVTKWVGPDGFIEIFKREAAKKPDVLIVDNISDLFDLAVLELKDSPNAPADPRQCHFSVQETLKRLSRQSNSVAAGGVNVLFLAWEKMTEMQLPNGKRVVKFEPRVPDKIIDSMCGLCQIVGRVTSDTVNGQQVWFYDLKPSELLRAKDQVWGDIRTRCLPKDLFTPPAPPQGGKK